MISSPHDPPCPHGTVPPACSPRALAPCLLDRLEALTSVACEACIREDIPELERLILARDEVIANLGHALEAVRARPVATEAGDESPTDALTTQAHAFELLEARFVACVRALRDQAQAALAAAANGEAATNAYLHARPPGRTGLSRTV